MEEETDLYGFQLKLNLQQQAIRMQCDGISRRNESSWASIAQQQQLPAEAKLKGMLRLVSSGSQAATQNSNTQALNDVYPASISIQGVPPPLRSFVWMETSGASAKKAAVGVNYFSNMCLAGDSSPYLKEIDAVRAV